MNKKMIKIIAGITCGLGIVGSIPFATTSCKKTSGGDQPIPPGPSFDPIINNLIVTDESDWENWSKFNNFSQSGTNKFDIWELQGINGVILPTIANTIVPPALNWPSFMHILEVPEQITSVWPYVSGELSQNMHFNSNITKIIFDSQTLSIGRNSVLHDEGPFDESQLLNTIVFNNITSLTIQDDIDFSKVGIDSPWDCRVIFGDNVQDQNLKNKIFQILVDRGLPQEKWTHN